MWRIKRWVARWGNLLDRRRAEREMAREMESHLTLIEEEYVRRGFSAAEAQRIARRSFGNVSAAKEDVRDMWSWIWLERLQQDTRYGLRALRKNPGFALTAILTLALGISVNTAIFSALDAVVLHPLPYPQSDRLVRISPGKITSVPIYPNCFYAAFVSASITWLETNSFLRICIPH
jgi:hypothetical protein